MFILIFSLLRTITVPFLFSNIFNRQIELTQTSISPQALLHLGHWGFVYKCSFCLPPNQTTILIVISLLFHRYFQFCATHCHNTLYICVVDTSSVATQIFFVLILRGCWCFSISPAAHHSDCYYFLNYLLLLLNYTLYYLYLIYTSYPPERTLGRIYLAQLE